MFNLCKLYIVEINGPEKILQAHIFAEKDPH